MGKIILYIATSVDGFIARTDGTIDWLTKYDSSKEDYGYTALLKRVGTIVLGGKTYRQVEKDVNVLYANKEVYVFSRREYKTNLSNIHFVNGDVSKIIKNMKSKTKKDIWLVGGANLVTQFINYNLIDEYIITLVPILLGKGIRLFESKEIENQLKLIDIKKFKSGLVLLSYTKNSNSKK